MFPPRLVEPMDEHGALRRARGARELLEEVFLRSRLREVRTAAVQSRARQVHVRVDKSGDDGCAGKLDGAISGRRIPGADTLDVSAVDEQPLAVDGVRERANARGP